jgi:phage terminase small subunit
MFLMCEAYINIAIAITKAAQDQAEIIAIANEPNPEIQAAMHRGRMERIERERIEAMEREKQRREDDRNEKLCSAIKQAGRESRRGGWFF